MSINEPSIDDDEFEQSDIDEDEFLQELFAAGKLKSGLNVPQKQFANNVQKINEVLDRCSAGAKELPWIERLDSVNNMAELAPELAVEIKEQEEMVKSGRSNSLSLNEFKRETLFHRQAQLAVIEALARMKSLGIPTLRPDDYFAEMMKSDDHMQKVRRSLLEKQAGLQRSEKVKQIRQHKKIAKQKQVENTLRKQKEKREMNEEIKKYRKGFRKDLDFLDQNSKERNRKPNNEHAKKPGKKNSRPPGKTGRPNKNKNLRPGKSRRKAMKNKKR